VSFRFDILSKRPAFAAFYFVQDTERLKCRVSPLTDRMKCGIILRIGNNHFEKGRFYDEIHAGKSKRIFKRQDR